MKKPEKPSNQEFKKTFDGIATRYNEVSNQYLIRLRKNILGNWAKGRCLEVGAGTGEISEFISQNHEVVATDIAPKMVEEIKKRGIEAYICDAEKLPFEDSSFDSVIAAELIFYLDNQDKFLSEAYRILKPEGRLLISCASNFPVKIYDRVRKCLRALGIRKGMYFNEDTLHEFMTPPKLKQMLHRNNFEIVETKKTPILPFAAFDFLNTTLEKTPLKHFGIFIFALAQKR